MVKDLRVPVPLKKSSTLYFARVHLYCSLRPLMHGMTTLVPSMNLPVDGFGFLLVSVWVWFVKRNVLGSRHFVGLCECDLFLLQELQM